MMMFTSKRDDTLVRTIEHTYRIELNARDDMKLRTLLQERGFQSLSQLLTAYQGRAKRFAKKRRVFLSFDADDMLQVRGVRLMARNPLVDVEFHETSLRTPINSQNASYVRQVIKGKISRASVLICLIGNATAWSDWVRWEVNAARELNKGVCGIRLKGSRGRTPPVLVEVGARVAAWDTPSIIAAIECAAARRS